MRTNVSVSVSGNAGKTLDELKARLAKNAEQAVKGVAEMIYVTSQDSAHVPVVTGTLKSSGEVLHTPAGLASTAGVGYGLDPSYFKTHNGRKLYPHAYAVRVHELMTPGPESQKKNDYLQRAVEDRFEEAANYVLSTMKR
jgi:hypothetical protein